MAARTQLATTQRKLVEDAIARHRRLDDAAKEIGIGRTTLWRWMRRFNMKREPDSAHPATDKIADSSPN